MFAEFSILVSIIDWCFVWMTCIQDFLLSQRQLKRKQSLSKEIRTCKTQTQTWTCNKTTNSSLNYLELVTKVYWGIKGNSYVQIQNFTRTCNKTTNSSLAEVVENKFVFQIYGAAACDLICFSWNKVHPWKPLPRGSIFGQADKKGFTGTSCCLVE